MEKIYNIAGTNDNLKHRHGKIFAFTLAEVLITLSIIGIVAAITIPTLMNNIADAQYKTAFKKSYTNLSQVFLTILNENGGSIKGVAATADDFENLFIDKMSVVKKCDGTTTPGGCWYEHGGFLYDGSAIYGFDAWWFATYTRSVVLKDGSSLMFDFDPTTYKCDYADASYPECARIFIDTNGYGKKPNASGKDIILLRVYPDKIKPSGNGQTCTSMNDCGTYYLTH